MNVVCEFVCNIADAVHCPKILLKKYFLGIFIDFNSLQYSEQGLAMLVWITLVSNSRPLALSTAAGFRSGFRQLDSLPTFDFTIITQYTVFREFWLLITMTL
jgi:hypothetical protein